MALVVTATALAFGALAFSIFWAATLAPPDSAAGVWPFIVAFAGAAFVAASASYALARRRGHASMAPLVLIIVVAVVVLAAPAFGNVAGWFGLFTIPLATIGLWVFSATAVHRLRASRKDAQTVSGE